MTKFFIPLLLSFFVMGEVSAQKKVLGYPENLTNLKNPFNNNNYPGILSRDNLKKKDRNKAWWVVVDREGVKAYYDNNPSSSVRSTLKFGEVYYVTKEEEEWVYLVDAYVDKLEIQRLKSEKGGWVKKEQLLLWNEGLLNERTGINLKAMLLNRFDAFTSVPCDIKEIVKVYIHPTSEMLKDTIRIYRMYFVYKIEGGKYLLAETPGLSALDPKYLLGWVDKNRLAEWNTRLALEPNFTEEGYRERKNNPLYRVKGFKDNFGAEDYAQGRFDTKEVVWQRDPVAVNDSMLSSFDKKRFRGDLMRFPLLSIGGGGKGNSAKEIPFKSAVCDNISLKRRCVDGVVADVEVMTNPAYLDWLKSLEKYQKLGSEISVFFVLEGTPAMASYRDALVQNLDEIKSVVRSRVGDKAIIQFGALVYKDIGELGAGKDEKSLVTYQVLTTDIGRVKQFLSNAPFSTPNSNGNYPALKLGMKVALQVAGFKNLQNNLMFLVGSKADFTYDDDAVEANPKLVVENKVIIDNMALNNINLMAIQCIGGASQGTLGFARDIRGFILESVRKHYNETYGRRDLDRNIREAFANLNYEPSPPEMIDPDKYLDTSYFKVRNSTLNSGIFRIKSPGQALAVDNFIDLIKNTSSAQATVGKELEKKLESWKNGPIDAEAFSEREAMLLSVSSNGIKIPSSIVSEKFELYKELWFARKPTVDARPSFSYVLFWPERDLIIYYNLIKEIITGGSDFSCEQKREKLKNLYCKLVEEFSGKAMEKDCTEYSIDEIFAIMQGVEDEGLDMGLGRKTIKCILQNDCTPCSEVEDMLKKWATVNRYLGNIIGGTGDEKESEFKFKRGDQTFFWIKVDKIY